MATQGFDKSKFEALPPEERIRRMLNISVFAGAMADGECGDDKYNAHTSEEKESLENISKYAEKYIAAVLKRVANKYGREAAISMLETAIADRTPE